MTFGLCSTTNLRMRCLRLVLLGSMLSGILCCLPLWLNTREYPAVPLFPHWLILPPSYGPLLLGLVLVSLVAAVWFFRPATLFLLVAILYLFGCDLNREQPWDYIYWVMLWLTFLPEPSALAACRLALSLVYFWAGVQKINGSFFDGVPAWFVQPAADWGLPNAIVATLRICVLLTPFLEIFIAVGVWFGKTRWFALGTVVILHLAALLFLGPFGHNVNLSVWPWNLAMIALVVVLFATKEPVAPVPTWRELRRSPMGAVIIGLYGFLPILSFFGAWDSYLSFALYSSNLAKADVYLSQSFVDHLPPKLRPYVYPVKHYNPAFQLPYMFEYMMWAEADMGSPPLPEPRGDLIMFRHLASYAVNDDDGWMMVKTRAGRVLLYRLGASSPMVLK